VGETLVVSGFSRQRTFSARRALKVLKRLKLRHATDEPDASGALRHTTIPRLAQVTETPAAGAVARPALLDRGGMSLDLVHRAFGKPVVRLIEAGLAARFGGSGTEAQCRRDRGNTEKGRQ
jgi:hypothetical protein